jgi:predicted RecB family endonuclease
MSKNETPLTRRFWDETGGTLIEEFRAVESGASNGQRLLDGVILVGGVKKIAKSDEVIIEGKDIFIIQTKASRLGMNVMGQAFFSIELMKKFKPKSIRAVVVCTKDDEVMRALAEKHGLEIKIYER